MKELLLTPLLIIAGALVFFALSLPKAKSLRLAKLGRIGAIAIILFNVYYLMNALNEYSSAAQKRIQAGYVTEFTKTVVLLIKSNRSSDAILMLESFSEKYPSMAGNDKATQEYIGTLIRNASANPYKASPRQGQK